MFERLITVQLASVPLPPVPSGQSTRGRATTARSLGAPLVPPLRFWRIFRILRSTADVAMPMTAWPLLTLLLAAHAASDVAGYWRLVDNIEAQYEQFELHRLSGLRREERAVMTGAAGVAPGRYRATWNLAR